MEHMTPFDDTEYLSDIQSDSECSSSANSAYTFILIMFNYIIISILIASVVQEFC